VSQLDRHSSGGPPRGSLRLDKANGKLAGVCAGLARHFGIDPLVVRLIFVLGTLIGFGSFVIIYLAIWLLAK
jgi:phage shock protein PspC (stress-responsive transcriptional regulator)